MLFGCKQLKKTEHAWEFNFNLLWDDHIRALNSFDENMKTGMKLYEHLGHVRTKSKGLFGNSALI